MPTAIQHEDEDDDDWSDFAAAGPVDSTLDLVTLDRKPTESLSRSHDATVRWGQPGGAIPLSIFGEEETDDVEVEEGSGRDDPRVADVKEEVWRDANQADVKDLIANFYGQDGKASCPRESTTELEFNADGEVSGRNWVVGGGITDGGRDEVVDEDDEWEFRAAPKEMATKNGVVQGGPDLMSSGTFTTWDALSFEAHGHPKFNLFIPNVNGHGLDSFTKKEDGDGDDGWEFQDSRLESHYSGHMNKLVGDTVKVEDREVVISNKALNGATSDVCGLGPVSGSCNDGFRLDVAQKNADVNDGSRWEFHASGTESPFRVENLAVVNCERNVNSAMRKVASDDDFWELKDAVPGNGRIYHDKLEDLSSGSETGKTHGNIDPGENLWESGNAISEKGLEHEKNEQSWDTKEALPLSLFGEEELENGYDLPIQNDFIIKGDVLMVKGDHGMRGRTTRDTSITDLLTSLYGQPLPSPPTTEVHEVTQGRLDSVTTGSEQVGVSEEDDFGNCDFHGASVDSRGGSPSLDEHIQPFNSSVLSSTPVSPETVFLKENSQNSSNDMSREYTDVFLQANSAEQSYVLPVAHENPSTKLKLNDLVHFYNSLEGELRAAASFHLNTGEIHEDVNLKLHIEEFQGLYNELQTGELVSEIPSISSSQSDINIEALLETLREPKFQMLEKEYSLSRRLLMAKKNVNSLVELLKHTALVLRLLRLGTEEEHNRYVSKWFKMIIACSKELKRGATIWRKSLEHDFQGQILSKTEGKWFILSLGEIYRVVEVLGVSVSFYKPWLLSSTDFPGITALLHECASDWSSSGLENALRSIVDPLEFQYEGSVEALVESIEQVRNINICVLGEMIFASEDPLCRLSLLIPGAVPGMKMVSWNGEQYFLKLINLWAHLISSEPPELPRIYLCPG